MNGVTFESDSHKYHTYEDWGLFLSSFDAGIPDAKTEYVEIVGGNGSVDLTEAYGHIYYNDRTVTITLQGKDDELRFNDKLNRIAAALNGRKFKITADYDDKWYFIGRIEINKYTSSKRLGKAVLKAVCEPFKYKRYKTTIVEEITASSQINAKNARMEVIPAFTATAAMTLTYKGTSYSLPANQETKFSGLVLEEGDNLITVAGTGTVTIFYQEGTL